MIESLADPLAALDRGATKESNRMGVIRQSGFVAVSSVALCVYGDRNVSAPVRAGTGAFAVRSSSLSRPTLSAVRVDAKRTRFLQWCSGAEVYAFAPRRRAQPSGSTQRCCCGPAPSNRKPGDVGRPPSRCPSGCGAAAGGM
jgi:hypothetical protein